MPGNQELIDTIVPRLARNLRRMASYLHYTDRQIADWDPEREAHQVGAWAVGHLIEGTCACYERLRPPLGYELHLRQALERCDRTHRITPADLIRAGLITPPLALRADYLGTALEATIDAAGKVVFATCAHDSLSLAGKMARQSVTGPWDYKRYGRFWRRQAKGGRWTTVNEATVRAGSLPPGTVLQGECHSQMLQAVIGEEGKVRFNVYDLRLMSWGDGTAVPTSGNSLVVAGTDGNSLLHVRVLVASGARTDAFEAMDGNGRLRLKTVDASGSVTSDLLESNLDSARAGTLSALKQQLPGLLPPHVLTPAEKLQVLGQVTSILRQARFNGEPYDSLAEAAEAARESVVQDRAKTNGWGFWHFQDEKGDWLPLDQKQREFWTALLAAADPYAFWAAHSASGVTLERFLKRAVIGGRFPAKARDITRTIPFPLITMPDGESLEWGDVLWCAAPNPHPFLDGCGNDKVSTSCPNPDCRAKRPVPLILLTFRIFTKGSRTLDHAFHCSGCGNYWPCFGPSQCPRCEVGTPVVRGGHPTRTKVWLPQ
jgi:hypothetical protein